MKKLILSFALIASVPAMGQTQNQPKDTATYILAGKFETFELLYRAVLSPGDVTPNQQKALAEWLKSIQPIPVKKEEEPKDKPVKK